MSDHNRRFKKIVRVDDATDAKIRAYALTVAAGRLEAVDRHEDGKKARAS